ncbi:metallophosphoesterase [Curtobacterium sp. MCBD17_040]|uniref:metallophosphoesterase n=1 Tax=Curtobacterium sp. MCBD17_040 TaxID=2175674 RepID=UPI000DAA8104|nr:metallophosphoesterase [Curtobacterium sp. MCBD17_040]WIB64292.1 metallophosphoesterase [Curtobacterium sp. MCBD17_040]
MLPVAPGALRVLHLSDTHLTGDGSLHNGVVDTAATLAAVLARVADVPGVGLVVVSGDCSDDGTPASYQALLDRVGAWARAHGSAVVAVPGNHDGRAGFREVLGNGHVFAEGGAPVAHTLQHVAPSVPVDGVSMVAGRRIITLDTSVPGAGYGLLRPEQLERLRELLADPAPYGTVLVLHHSPLPAPTALHEALRLQNPDELADALRGSDVRVVLAGHYHHHMVGTITGVPVLVAPGVANDTDIAGVYERERILAGAGALVVDVPAEGTVLSTPVHVPVPDEGRELFTFDEARVARIAAESGPRR